jgi:hypothetical protein
LLPVVTVIAPPFGMPRVKREVPDESGAVPVPVAGVGEVGAVEVDELELDEPELDAVERLELEEPELDDPVDEVESPVADCKADCTAAESCVLTRLNAVWFAMLARPVDKFVIAELITLITASVCA